MQLDNNQIVENKFNPQKNIQITKILQWILLGFTLIWFIRIPFIGSFFDSLIDLCFGPVKYVLYFTLIFVLPCQIFKPKFFKIKITKNKIFLYFLSLLFLSCMYTSFFYSFNDANLIDAIKTYWNGWKEYFAKNIYEQFFHYSGAGIFAVTIIVLSKFLFSVLVGIIFMILFFLIILTILEINYKNFKVWLKVMNFCAKKLGMVLNIGMIEEIKKSKSHVKFAKISKKKMKNLANCLDVPPLSLLPENDINNQTLNENEAINLKNKILAYLIQEEIEVSDTKIKCFNNFSEIKFDFSRTKMLTKFKSNLNQILTIAKITQFVIDQDDDSIKVQFANKYITKNCLAKVTKNVQNIKAFDMIIGFDLQNQPIIKNLYNSPNTLIIGKKMSGAASLVIIMVLCLCLSTSPNKLEINFLSSIIEPNIKLFKNALHVNNNIYSDTHSSLDKMKKIVEEIKLRINLLKTNNVSSIQDYNEKIAIDINTQKLKSIVLIITNLHFFFKNEDTELVLQNLFFILENGKKCGVYCILSSQSVCEVPIMNKILKYTNDKFIFGLNYEYESFQIFNDKKANKLFGYGDCYYFNSEQSSKHPTQLQCCYISKNELEYDLNSIINAFYYLKK